MTLLTGVLVVGAIAAAAQAERKGVLQAMVARPLVLGPLLGWALGDPVAGLLIGAPLELLWLGGLNVGANLPDHEVVGVCAAVGGAILASGGAPVGAGLALLALILLAPLAVLGRWLDGAIERQNVALADQAALALAAGRDSPAAVNVLGLLAPSLAAALVAGAGAGAGAVALPPLLEGLGPEVGSALGLAWLGVGAIAAAAAISTIRIRRGPFLASLGALLGLALVALLGATGGYGP